MDVQIFFQPINQITSGLYSIASGISWFIFLPLKLFPNLALPSYIFQLIWIGVLVYLVSKITDKPLISILIVGLLIVISGIPQM